MRYQRIIMIVIDSLGVGAMHDAEKYHDEGCDTLGHIDACKNLHIPNLTKLGLANLHPLTHVKPIQEPIGYYTKLSEQSSGKDTISGHWEMMGLPVIEPFPTFSENGFPQSLISELEQRCGCRLIGNKASSGTEILKELGTQAYNENCLIIYTSADSVLQLCAHEERFGLDRLYQCCEIARELTMKKEWKVGRVIARPFIGNDANSFVRTANRYDYALKPHGKTVLNELQNNGFDVIGIGKIHDIFAGEGIKESYRSKSSVMGMEQTIELMKRNFHGLCFVNLVDFDALWGHRRDPLGYGRELERFDELLGELINALKADDLLMITADHGNDPTFRGSDHTREAVPLLLYAKSMQGHGLLPLQDSFAAVGKTIADNFEVPQPRMGTSFIDLLR